jgi:integrase
VADSAVAVVPPIKEEEGLARLRGLVLDSVLSPHSRRAYARALDDFLGWYLQFSRSPLSKAVVQEYRAELDLSGLAASTINVRLAAIKKLAAEAADNALLDPVLAAGIARIKGAKQLGVRAGNWLTREEARLLVLAPDATTLKGKRDRALLGVLIGCGLRRSELVALTIDHLQQRDARWVLLDLVGKGRRLRTVAVPNWTKVLIDDWVSGAGIREGKLFRAVDKVDRSWGSGVTEKVVWWTVLEYARPLGFANLAPHDLRRYAECRTMPNDLGGRAPAGRRS